MELPRRGSDALPSESQKPPTEPPVTPTLAEPCLTALDTTLLDPPLSEAGKLSLVCDLTSDTSLVEETLESKLVVFVRPGAAPTGPTVYRDVESDAASGVSALRWPVPGQLRVIDRDAEVMSVHLPIGSAGIDQRAWVLFLDDCRSHWQETVIVLPAACRREIAWFAPRCDASTLFVHAGRTATPALHAAELKLAKALGNKARCLIVDTGCTSAAA